MFSLFQKHGQKRTYNLHPTPVSSSPVSFIWFCDFHFLTKAHVDGIMSQLIFVPRSSPLKMRKKTGFGLTPAACAFFLFASFLSHLIRSLLFKIKNRSSTGGYGFRKSNFCPDTRVHFCVQVVFKFMKFWNHNPRTRRLKGLAWA